MEAIHNNPFRVLGLKTTASDREITKRISDLLLYAEMGKKVRYETDFEFLGEVDRSIDNIKEAAKRIENNDLKLFFSLMWFEIKDEVDESAFKFFEKNEYDNAKKLLEDDVFANSPIVYNTLGRIWGGKQIDVIAWGNMTNSKLKDTPHITNIKYEINLENTPPKGLELFSLSKRFRVSTFQSELIQIEESKSDIPVIKKYQICLNFLPIQQYSKKIVLTISSVLEDNIEFDFVIDFENILTITKKNINNKDNETIIYSSKIEIDYSKDNTFKINKIDNIIEIIINNQILYSIDNNYSFSSFYISTLGSVFINELTLSELANRKLYSDIELNDNTSNRIKNLALMILIGEDKNFRPKSNLRFFELFGLFYKQKYFDQYSKGIVTDNYKIDVLKITDLFVNEFYMHFKSGNIIDNKHPELYFSSVFSYFSVEARKIADNKIMGQSVYEFEDLISKTSKDRLGKMLNCAISADNLYKSALVFFKWYSEFYSWENINYMKMQEKVGNELLECGISYYNSSQQVVENAFVAINIIEQASEFARSLETRERIQKNINIISELHSLDKITIDFVNMDISNYVRSCSNPDVKVTKKPITPKIETNLVTQDNTSDISEIIVNKKNEKNFYLTKMMKITFILVVSLSIILLFFFLFTD